MREERPLPPCAAEVGTSLGLVKAAVRDTRRGERTGPEKRLTARGHPDGRGGGEGFTLIELLVVWMREYS